MVRTQRTVAGMATRKQSWNTVPCRRSRERKRCYGKRRELWFLLFFACIRESLGYLNCESPDYYLICRAIRQIYDIQVGPEPGSFCLQTHILCYHFIPDFRRFFMTKMLPNATTPMTGNFGKRKLQSPSPFDSKKQRLTNGLFHAVLY